MGYIREYFHPQIISGQQAKTTFRTDAGYAHMGDIWFEGVKAAAEKSLITAPVELDSEQ